MEPLTAVEQREPYHDKIRDFRSFFMSGINSRFDVMRGEIMTLIECLGLKETQEASLKTSLKKITGGCWTDTSDIFDSACTFHKGIFS